MKQKAILTLLGLVAAGTLLPAVSNAANIGFDDPYYDPTTPAPTGGWSFVQTREDGKVDPPDVLNGSVATSTTAVTLTNQEYANSDPDGVCGGDCASNVQFFIPVAGAGDVSFDWEYTGDGLFGAALQPFGYILDSYDSGGNFVLGGDGVVDQTDFVTIENNCCGFLQPVTETGSTTVAGVLKDQLFGWWLLSDTSELPAATATITNLSAPPAGEIPEYIPVPGPLALLGFGLLIPSLRRRLQA